MPANTFGTAFSVTTFGESHGAGLGCVIDGCPAGIAIDPQVIATAMARRRPGQSKLVTPRDEADQVEILSGVDVDSGVSLGSPIALLVRNQDQRSRSYEDWHHIYRPSHADFAYDAKYGIRAWQGGGRASARETVGRVAAGAIAELVLQQRFPDLRITAWVEQVADQAATITDPTAITRDLVDEHPTRCPDAPAAEAMAEAILTAKKRGDSLGGYVRCVVTGAPPGLGDPIFDKLDAILAQAMLSLPACKGVEIGSGFAGPIDSSGLSHNDHFAWSDAGEMTTATNRSGGIQGGISNGMPIDLRAVFKPTATVLKPQPSADHSGNNVELQAKGRHDPCVLPRAVPIVEAMVALTLVDAFIRQRGQIGDPWPGLNGPLHPEPSAD